MKKFVTLALVGALVLGVSSVVYANVCAFDPVPAATILFPFVEFDYNNPANGQTTLFSITNVSAEAQIVHVTLWTDFSAAVLDFNILLTGYDVISMNIRDLLANGTLPVTLQEGHKTQEGVAVNGPVSAANTLNGAWLDPGMDFPDSTLTLGDRCNSDNLSYPGRYAGGLSIADRGALQSYLQVSQIVPRQYTDDCDFVDATIYDLIGTPGPFWANRTTDDPTWLYITADVVEQCNKLFPDSVNYYTGMIRYDNVLIGDMFWVNDELRLSEAGNAVHLEASEYLAEVATIGDFFDPISFYHRYSSAQLVDNDLREPLPTAWAFRYMGWNQPGIDTDIRVWKGSTNFKFTNDLDRIGGTEFQPDKLVATNCYAYTYYAWDEEENVTTAQQTPWSSPINADVIPNLIPLETQQVPVEQFVAPGAFGWMLFVWPASNYPDPNIPDDYYQTWMGVRYNAFGAWSAAMDAAVMANYNCYSDQVLPNLGVNYMYVDAFGYTTSP